MKLHLLLSTGGLNIGWKICMQNLRYVWCESYLFLFGATSLSAQGSLLGGLGCDMQCWELNRVDHVQSKHLIFIVSLWCYNYLKALGEYIFWIPGWSMIHLHAAFSLVPLYSVLSPCWSLTASYLRKSMTVLICHWRYIVYCWHSSVPCPSRPIASSFFDPSTFLNSSDHVFMWKRTVAICLSLSER